MATLKQKLSVGVAFGGHLDPSWSGSVKAMEKGVDLLTARAKGLAKEQRALASRIREASAAGKDITTLQHHYDRLTRSIQAADKSQGALNGKLKHARLRERITGGALTAAKGVGKSAAWMGGGLMGSAAGAVTGMVAMNRETAENAGKARTYGVDVATFNAWEGLGQQMGLNGENIGDLFEEYKNKVSDNKDDPSKGALAEAFPLLGITAHSMAGKSNEQQVGLIFDKLSAMTDTQRAAGIADKIFGGEGNKILTYMQQTGKGYQALMAQQRRYSLVTQAGADGAVAGSVAFSNVWHVMSSSLAEIAGQLGGELSPAITGIADQLSAWMKEGGIESIKDTIKNDVIPGALAFGKGLVYVGEVAFALAKKLSWLLPDEKEQAAQKDQLIARVASGNASAALTAKHAESLGLGDWFATTGLNNPETVNKLQAQWRDDQQHRRGHTDETRQRLRMIADPHATKNSGFMSALAGTTDSASPIADAAARDQQGGPRVHNEYKPQVRIAVYQQPGEDGSALAGRVSQAIQSVPAHGGFSAMADMPWRAN